MYEFMEMSWMDGWNGCLSSIWKFHKLCCKLVSFFYAWTIACLSKHWIHPLQISSLNLRLLQHQNQLHQFHLLFFYLFCWTQPGNYLYLRVPEPFFNVSPSGCNDIDKRFTTLVKSVSIAWNHLFVAFKTMENESPELYRNCCFQGFDFF